MKKTEAIHKYVHTHTHRWTFGEKFYAVAGEESTKKSGGQEGIFVFCSLVISFLLIVLSDGQNYLLLGSTCFDYKNNVRWETLSVGKLQRGSLYIGQTLRKVYVIIPK